VKRLAPVLFGALFLLAGPASAVLPRAYVGLASVSAGIGYHGWTVTTRGTEVAWFDAGLQAIEGTWFLNRRLGLGLRVFDGALCPVIGDSMAYPVMFGFVMPKVSWVLNHDAKRFGYLDLALMPYMPDDSGQTQVVSSAVALDYGYVPFAPWPLEGRVRVATMVFNWAKPEVAWQLSAGIRAGLGWWFTKPWGPPQV